MMADTNVTILAEPNNVRPGGGVSGMGCVKIVVWTKIRLGLS
jgi:hypothetical protein